MKSKSAILSLAGLFYLNLAFAQNPLVFDGQLSALGNYAPQNQLEYLFGGRYIPELGYKIPLDSNNVLDFFASANINGSVAFHPWDSTYTVGDISPYRIWARITGKQYELRLGLQKIDFSVATVLRPLQWFNQIDPRDPLSITNGVSGILGRYYFLNNANVWFWVLYGNGDRKGFEVIGTNESLPELGGRVQLPVPRGEIGLSYHYRSADSRKTEDLPQFERIPEDRFGIDAKWDLKVGIWLEASHIHKTKDLGIFSNQTLINLGTDYTFGIGNGLNLVVEHLIAATDEKAFQFSNTSNTTAATAAYPIGFFDNINSVATYNWDSSSASFFLNYEHRFNKFSGYVMFSYNPETPPGFVNNDENFVLTGPGIRLMVVYNH